MFNRRKRQETSRRAAAPDEEHKAAASEVQAESSSVSTGVGQPIRRRDREKTAAAVDSVTQQRLDELKREIGFDPSVPVAPAPAEQEAPDLGGALITEPEDYALEPGQQPARRSAQTHERPARSSGVRKPTPRRKPAAEPISDTIPAAEALGDVEMPASGSQPEQPVEKAPEARRMWSSDGASGFKPVDSIPQYEGRFAHIGEDPHARVRRGNPAAGGIARGGVVRDERLGHVKVHARSLLSATEHDELINWEARLARETPLYRRAFAMGDIKKVASIGCGSGQQAIMFAQWGLDVIGIESDNKLFSRAQELASEHDKEIAGTGGSIRFVKADLTSVDEAIGDEKVNAIVCVGDALPRVDSLSAIRRVLESFASVLAPSGILVLEFVNHTAFTQKKIRSTRPEVYDTVAGTKVFLEVMDYPAGSSVVDTDFLSLTRNEDGKWAVESAHRRNIFVSPTGITRELYEVGFDVIELAGDFDGSELSMYNDDTIVIIARRKRHSVRARHGRKAQQAPVPEAALGLEEGADEVPQPVVGVQVEAAAAAVPDVPVESASAPDADSEPEPMPDSVPDSEPESALEPESVQADVPDAEQAQMKLEDATE